MLWNRASLIQSTTNITRIITTTTTTNPNGTSTGIAIGIAMAKKAAIPVVGTISGEVTTVKRSKAAIFTAAFFLPVFIFQV